MSRVELVFFNSKTKHFAYFENKRLQFRSEDHASMYKLVNPAPPNGMKWMTIPYKNEKEIDEHPDRVNFNVLKEEVK